MPGFHWEMSKSYKPVCLDACGNCNWYHKPFQGCSPGWNHTCICSWNQSKHCFWRKEHSYPQKRSENVPGASLLRRHAALKYWYAACGQSTPVNKLSRTTLDFCNLHSISFAPKSLLGDWRLGEKKLHQNAYYNEKEIKNQTRLKTF